MIWNYITYLIFIQFGYGFLGNILLFPIAYHYREKLRSNDNRKWYQNIFYWVLHDYSEDDIWEDYGDKYFNPELKKTFWIAWRWVWRNPIHNWQVDHKFKGTQTGFNGWETCQRDNARYMWRTAKTKDINGEFQDKNGKYMDFTKGVYGKQNITFKVGDKRVFRCSSANPIKLWKNLYWLFSYKFGFGNVNWAIQFHPFTFLRLMEGDNFKLTRYEYS